MQERKDEKFRAACPYGCLHTGENGKLNENLKFKLSDVDPNNQLKKYSDSQDVSELQLKYG